MDEGKNIFNNIGYLLAPNFSIRYYLFHDIRQIVTGYKLQGNLLDVGCGQKPYKQIFKNTTYQGIDFKKYSKYKGGLGDEKPDKFFDKNYTKTGKLPFSNNQFDVVCSFQVLEHVKDPQKLITEMFRVLKSGGHLLISLPFIWGLHEEPNDYFRFSHYILRDWVETNHGKIVLFKKQGSIFTTKDNLSQNYLVEFANRNKLFKHISFFLYPLFLMMSYLAIVADKLIRSDKVFLNYIFLIKKGE